MTKSVEREGTAGKGAQGRRAAATSDPWDSANVVAMLEAVRAADPPQTRESLLLDMAAAYEAHGPTKAETVFAIKPHERPFERANVATSMRQSADRAAFVADFLARTIAGFLSGRGADPTHAELAAIGAIDRAMAHVARLDGPDAATARARRVTVLLDMARDRMAKARALPQWGARWIYDRVVIMGGGLDVITEDEWTVAVSAWRGAISRPSDRPRYSWASIVVALLAPHGLIGTTSARNLSSAQRLRRRRARGTK